MLEKSIKLNKGKKEEDNFDVNYKYYHQQFIKNINNWYPTILHSMSDIFFATDMNMHFLDINNTFSRKLGYSLEELQSKTIFDFDLQTVMLNNQDRSKLFEPDLYNLKEFGSSTRKVKLACKNGSILIIDTTAKYLDIGPGIILHFGKDITEEEKLFKQLKESEERYRALIELGDRVGEAVVMIQDTDKGRGMQAFVSDKWLDITGYSKEELLDISFFDLLHPKYRRDSIKRHYMKMKGHKIPDHFEMSIIRKDGTEVPIECTSGYSTYQGKKVNVTYIRDITERKKIERELEQYRNSLEELVEKRTKELEKVNKKLKLLLKKQREQVEQRIYFTRSIVHDLKTPLTAINNSSEALIKQNQSEMNYKLSTNIFKSAKKLDNRIDELLDLAKSEVGILSVKRMPLDVLRLVNEIFENMELEAEKKEQKLRLEVPESLPLIMADTDRLEQILMNLISNALKYNKINGTITLKVSKYDSNVIFEVRDEGIGISHADQLKLFKPYQRFATDSEHFNGLGVGLALSKELVKLQNGKIWVESKEGKGSSFYISFPIMNKE